MGETRGSGSGAHIATASVRQARGPVASTSCLTVALLLVFFVLVVCPLALWLVGIACGS